MFVQSAMEKEGMMRLPALTAKEQELFAKQEGLLSEYSRPPLLAGPAMEQVKYLGICVLAAEEQAGSGKPRPLKLMFLLA